NIAQYAHRATKCMWTVAYLDGKTPSFVISRGIYHRIKLEAWNFRNDQLSRLWQFDSDNYGPEYDGQGNHHLSLADVDDDGRDEIVYGGMVVDDDGTGLYSTGLKHGDALHVMDIDPDRPGLEIWKALENNTGAAEWDARTGEILKRFVTNRDCGRACAGDITAKYPGAEFWAATECPLYSAKGEVIGSNNIPMNFMVWWDGDLLREFLDHNWLGTDLGTGIGTITKYNDNGSLSTLLTANGTYSNNYTKGTPCLSADILGDWREEVIWRTTDNTRLRIYTTTKPTTHRIYTLMHDPQYRAAIAWQNNSYNQPPHPSFFLGNGMDSVPPPPLTGDRIVWKGGSSWAADNSNVWLKGDQSVAFKNGDDVLFDISGDAANPVSVSGTITPASVTVYAPNDYVFDGQGDIAGTTGLLKDGSGSLTINNVNTFSGYTAVWNGKLVVNGSLSNSEVNVKRFASLMGKGLIGGGLTLEKKSILYPGENGIADTLRINNQLNLPGDVTLNLDLSDDPDGITGKNDLISVDGDVNIEGSNIFYINMTGADLPPGDYPIINYSGTFTGNLNNQKVAGIPGVAVSLKNTGTSIVLEVLALRAPAKIVWQGGGENLWDLVTSYNWNRNGTQDWFIPGDTVYFNDEGQFNDTVILDGQLQPASIILEGEASYRFTGTGSIVGSAGLTKTGSGNLFIDAKNEFTGPVKILNGSIEINTFFSAGKPGPLGAAAAAAENLILDGGTLKTSDSEAGTDRNVTIDPNGGTILTPASSNRWNVNGTITGPGKLTKDGYGVLALYSKNNYSGGTLLKKGTIILRNDDANIGGLGTGPVTIMNGSLIMNDDKITYTDNCDWDLIVPEGYEADLNLDSRSSLIGSLTGGGTLNLYTPFIRSELFGDWSAFTGNINVTTDNDGGTFLMGSKKGYGNATINLGGNVTAIYRNSANDTISIGALSGFVNAVLGAGGESTNTITWRIGTNNLNSTFNGIINNIQFKNSGAVASVIKAGSGTLTLTNENSYTGNTIIESGTLEANNSNGSATGTGDIIVKATGTLGGTGSVSGNVDVMQNGVLAPGDNGVGILTAAHDLTFEPGSYFAVETDVKSVLADILIVDGTLNLGGYLYMMNNTADPYQAGQDYKIFQAGSCHGKFDKIIPSTPGDGLVWDTANISITGYIRVKEATGTGIASVDNTIQIYPNPVKDKLNVSFGNYAFTGTVQVLNLIGRPVYSRVLNNAYNFQFNLSGIKPGIYFLKFKSTNIEIIKKLVINR
ncbi:MAG TPA: autotransporter-associated beta strand repeat-containing protein, partial [Bacteroidales bacterium]|nr:autotransporter-associated beta strand repeat-containing protein [Bacteroidales bacterium]